MKLEEQVVSLELAKTLKKLGVHQESSLVYEHDPSDGRYRLMNFAPDHGFPEFRFSSFTVAELGEMLPEEIEVGAQEAVIANTGTRSTGLSPASHSVIGWLNTPGQSWVSTTRAITS